MKIMHVAGGGDRGGAKPHILSLCSALSRDNDVRLFSLRSGEFSDDAIAAGIDTTVIYSRLVPLDYIKLIRQTRAYKPDVVHCHGAKANLAGALLKLFCKSTIVTTVHSDYKLDYMHSFVRRNTIGRINTLALRMFDYYVTVSDAFRSMMVSRGFCPQKIMTIYNGIDFSHKTNLPDRHEYLRSLGLDCKEDDIVVGIPARLNPVKDLPTLLRAFAIAREQNPKLKLVIGGDGEDMDKLQALVRELNISDSASLPGWISDVPSFFAACDIDVLCSISESFPYTILEGIREGCAVITSNVGGMSRLITHGVDGYIFEPGDVQTFAKYLLELSTDHDKRKAFAERLYDRASAIYSLDGMAREQVNIYKRILSLESRKSDRKRAGVVICGSYGRGNAGDEAILQAILGAVIGIDPDRKSTRLYSRHLQKPRMPSSA